MPLGAFVTNAFFTGSTMTGGAYEQVRVCVLPTTKRMTARVTRRRLRLAPMRMWG